VHQVWVEALADAVNQPYPHTQTLRGSGSPTTVVPAAHGGLIRNPAVQRIIAGVLAGTALPHAQPGAALHVLAAAAHAWASTELALAERIGGDSIKPATSTARGAPEPTASEVRMGRGQRDQRARSWSAAPRDLASMARCPATVTISDATRSRKQPDSFRC
jgi:hypothetical protein